MDQSTRAAAASFDAIAEEYDARRPGYPDELIELACTRAGLSAGSRVLEIGAGTGKLTGGLLARGLEVTAVEPGRHLAAFLCDRFAAAGALTVEVARLEEAELSPRSFDAAFSATAFHWVDPDVGWTRVADLLAPGARFGLLEHIGYDDPELGPDEHEVLDAVRRHAPEWAARWPPLRTREQVVAAAEAHRGNISALWSVLNGHDLARPAAAARFEPATIDVVPTVFEMTGAQTNALLATMSFHHRLTPAQVAAIESDVLACERRLGRPLRSAALAVLVTARVAA